MRSLNVLIYQSFLQLFRDKIFIPILVAACGLFMFSAVASEWGIEDFRKILFDFGFMGLSLLGSLVAIFWGVKLVCEDKEGGTIDLLLAAPVARWQIVAGRFFALILVLFVMALLLMCAWQLVMWWNNFGWMRPQDLVAFWGVVMVWFCMASVSLAMATLSGYTVALFASVCLWVLFRSSEAVYYAMPAQTDPLIKSLVGFFATYFNFAYFDFMSWTYVYSPVFFEWSEVVMRFSYGFIFMLVFFTLSVLAFEKKDF